LGQGYKYQIINLKGFALELGADLDDMPILKNCVAPTDLAKSKKLRK